MTYLKDTLRMSWYISFNIRLTLVDHLVMTPFIVLPTIARSFWELCICPWLTIWKELETRQVEGHYYIIEMHSNHTRACVLTPKD